MRFICNSNKFHFNYVKVNLYKILIAIYIESHYYYTRQVRCYRYGIPNNHMRIK